MHQITYQRLEQIIPLYAEKPITDKDLMTAMRHVQQFLSTSELITAIPDQVRRAAACLYMELVPSHLEAVATHFDYKNPPLFPLRLIRPLFTRIFIQPMLYLGGVYEEIRGPCLYGYNNILLRRKIYQQGLFDSIFRATS